MNFDIRPATVEDAATIAAIYAPYVVTNTVSFEETPPNAEEIARRITAAAPLYPWLVADAEGAVLGYAYATRFRERIAYRFSVETAIYVASEMHRQGIGRALYRSLIRTLTQQGFAQALATITLPNESSIEMHEAVGFQRAGVWRSVGYKHGDWRDVGLWQRPLAITGDPPAEPLSFAEIGVVRD